MEHVGEEAQAAREMFGDGRLADTHALGNFAAIQSFDTAEDNGLAAARRQPVYRRLKTAEFLMRDGRTIGRWLVGADLQRFEIGHRLDGHHLLLAETVDQKVARGRKNERLGRL